MSDVNHYAGRRVIEITNVLRGQMGTGHHVKLMPIGSEVPYEGEVLTVLDGLVKLRAQLTEGTEAEPPEFAHVYVGADRIEAVVILDDPEITETTP